MLSQIATDAVQNPKAAAVVATATTGSGLLTKIDLNAGDVALVAGAFLSIILIVTHIRREIRETKEHIKKMAVLDKELNNEN